MAKGSTAGAKIIRLPAAPRPIINVRAPSAPKTKHKHHRRGASSSGSMNELMTVAAAGFILGYLDKNGTNIPTVPVLGRAGTLAAICHYMRGQSFMGFKLGKLAPGFAAIAAYEYSTQGSISGPGDMGIAAGF